MQGTGRLINTRQLRSRHAVHGGACRDAWQARSSTNLPGSRPGHACLRQGEGRPVYTMHTAHVRDATSTAPSSSCQPQPICLQRHIHHAHQLHLPQTWVHVQCMNCRCCGQAARVFNGHPASAHREQAQAASVSPAPARFKAVIRAAL